MGITQRTRRRFKPPLITGDQQQIKTTRSQTLRVDRTDAGGSAGDEGCALGLDGSHDECSWEMPEEKIRAKVVSAPTWKSYLL
jgi:hypothetical protein